MKILVTLAVIALGAMPPAAVAQTAGSSTAAAAPRDPLGPYFEFEVDTHVMPLPGNPAAKYPEALRSAHVSGMVLLQFLVDTAGRPVPSSVTVLRSTHADFTQSARAVVDSMRYEPARLGGRKVIQLVQQPFSFSVSP